MVEHLPAKGKGPDPDFRINGETADVASPMTNSVTSIAKTIDDKVKRQAKNVVINLADSPMSASTLGQYIQLHPVPGLDKLFIIKNDKVIV